ncbi:MAG: hypothetical protein HYV97_11475 [Bdellovibrio sp.]|nr:hypothetical protein [Bdellovibrio sp.]
MKSITLIMAFVLTTSTAFGDDAALTTLLKDNKCSKCHVVKALGLIETKSKAPDLSHLSKEVTGYKKGPKKFIVAFLKKKLSKKGSKHKLAWKGSDADLDLIADGLIELNSRK